MKNKKTKISGAVKCKVLKDIPVVKKYGIDKERKPYIEFVKGNLTAKDGKDMPNIAFKKGDVVRFKWRLAGILQNSGHVQMLNVKNEEVDVKEMAISTK